MLEILLLILTSLILIGFLALSFYLGYKYGSTKVKPTNEHLNKDSLNFLNQYLNMMNYTGKRGGLNGKE